MKRFVSLMAAACSLAGFSSTAWSQSLTPIAFFDGSAGEFPEGIAVDADNNCYLSLVFGGRIKKVTPEGVESDFAQVADNWLLGMTFDRAGNLVLCGASGIWKISPAGVPSLFASVPGHAFLNDLVYDRHGNLYVTDSVAYQIWKIDPLGNAVAWSTDPLLQGVSGGLFPFALGPNGIRLDRDGRTLQIVNTSAGRVIQIDVKRDGSAGAARILVEDAALIGADGIDIDRQDNLYIAVNIQDRIARVTPCGELTDVVVDDLLATPTALAFMRGCGARSLYVCNNGNVFFSSTPLGEGLLRLELDHHRPARRGGCHDSH